jgi:hypothetical protein
MVSGWQRQSTVYGNDNMQFFINFGLTPMAIMRAATWYSKNLFSKNALTFLATFEEI